ncbi:hypothetical protein FRB99_006487 [Tulasnella sp. 403]|nr:hypothetical protein FRB99_006487 [Tulasnella sp. 403]
MSSLVPALERGKACVECRRRKQKCDGLKPSCNVCVRAHRNCRYEKPVTRPVSVVLQERLDELESKLRSLMQAPSTQAAQPTAAASLNALADTANMPPEMRGRWWEPAVLAPAVHDYLLEIFLRHHTRVHFYFHTPTFISRMSSSDPQARPHPGLLNSIYLLACYFATFDHPTPHLLTQHESHFLDRAQKALTHSLSLSDRLMDFLRGSNLVTAYFFMRGRFLEGYHVHCGTARFALSCGLHLITAHDLTPSSEAPVTSSIVLLPPAATRIELGDRLLTFWQIYWWDKVSAIIMGFIAALPIDADQTDGVQSIFPAAIEDYETDDSSELKVETVWDVINPGDIASGKEAAGRPDSPFTLELKAITLLDRANRLAQRHFARPSEAVMSSLRELHVATDHFAATLPPVTPESTASSSSDSADAPSTPPAEHQLAILISRSLTLGAILEMNNTTVKTDPQAYNARLTSASYIAALVFYFGDSNYQKAGLVTGASVTSNVKV